MSYILDALKKSEQQRGNGKIPDVQTVHSSSLNYRDDKKAYWPYFLIAAILLNLIAIIYFMYDKETTTVVVAIEDKEATPKIMSNKENIISNSSTATSSNENNPAPLTPEQNIVVPNNTSTKLKTTRSPAKAPRDDVQSDTVEFYDLPESLLRQIPSITVSAHIYSSNPLQRSIVINNKFLEEGDYVLDDLTLHEITKDGAIFNFNDTRFHYGIVSGWQ